MNFAGEKKIDALWVTIMTYRDVFMCAKKYEKNDEYEKLVAQVTLSPDDITYLGIKDKSFVKLVNEYATIVVQAKQDPNCPRGFGFMPKSQLANKIASYELATGKNPNFKRINARVCPVD